MLRALVLLACAVPVCAQFNGWPPMPEAAARLLMQGDAAGALEVLRKSGEAGDAVAMFWSGRFCEEVAGIPRDYLQAREWYRRAAGREIGVAAWSLGRTHEMGRGTPQDAAEARKWYARAAEFGFRRTALAVVKARWYPGHGELVYEPVPETLRNRPPSLSPELAFLDRLSPPDIDASELEALRAAGLSGRIVWLGGEPGLFGLPARPVLIAQRPVPEEVRLPVPTEGSVMYVQRDGEWQRLGEAKTGDRTVRIFPQSPEIPENTAVSIEMEDGGTTGGLGWSWGRP